MCRRAKSNLIIDGDSGPSNDSNDHDGFGDTVHVCPCSCDQYSSAKNSNKSRCTFLKKMDNGRICKIGPCEPEAF